jgi:hypothetical protein
MKLDWSEKALISIQVDCLPHFLFSFCGHRNYMRVRVISDHVFPFQKQDAFLRLIHQARS